MAPNDPIDDAAEAWLNEQVLLKLRYKQDYAIDIGSSEPLIRDGKNIGIKIARPYVKLFSTGTTKLYRIAVLGEKLPDVEYTPEEEAKFEAELEQQYKEQHHGTTK
jgi:hypothetical protein